MIARPRSPTPFEQKVYLLCKQIPIGRVSTYAALAKAANSSAQAVGQALKRNPYAPEVPCHRIIKSDLSLGGFCGQIKGAMLQRKLSLLRDEGVFFTDDGRIDPNFPSPQIFTSFAKASSPPCS